MSNRISKTRIVSSLFWKLMERGGTQGVQFVVSIVLARLLSPDQYGTIAVVTVFIGLAQVFVQSGLNTSLIQKKDADNLDFSSVFYVSLGLAVVLYVIIYLFSPVIAEYYQDPMLNSVLRVLAATLILGAINSIQNAYLARAFLFKQLFKSSLVSIVVSGALGIIAAYKGYGIWALVIQYIAKQLIITIIMWFTVKWRPHMAFSLQRVKQLFSFGVKLLVSQLLNVLYMDLRTLIIGKLYTSSMLGYYNKGQQFPKLIVTNIDGSIQSVMLPSLSAYQDNKRKVKDMMRRAVTTSSFLIFPMMAGMAIVAEPLVKILLTEKWLQAVPFLQIFCAVYAVVPIHTANLQAINAVGRSDIYLKIEILKKVTGLAILAISLPFGVYAIAIGQVVSGIVSTFINANPNRKLLDYSYKEQLMDLAPAFLITAVMGGVIYPVRYLGLVSWQTLAIQIIAGILVYAGMALILKVDAVKYLLKTMKEMVHIREKRTAKPTNEQ